MRIGKLLARLDRSTLLALRTRGHSPAAEKTAIAYAWTGEFGAIWIAIGLLAAAKTGRKQWLAMAAAVPTSISVNYAVKLIAVRPRPTIDGLDSLGRRHRTDSFPSGHAATSFAAAFAAPRMRPLFVAGASLMALTRPYLGVHYPSDVAVGATLGAVVGMGLRQP